MRNLTEGLPLNSSVLNSCTKWTSVKFIMYIQKLTQRKHRFLQAEPVVFLILILFTLLLCVANIHRVKPYILYNLSISLQLKKEGVILLKHNSIIGVVFQFSYCSCCMLRAFKCWKIKIIFHFNRACLNFTVKNV